MSEQILKTTADTILEKDIEIVIHEPVTRLKSGFLNWIKRRKETEVISHRFSLKPLSLGTILRISKLIVGINIDADMLSNTGDKMRHMHDLAIEHAETLVEIVAIALSNSKEQPSKKIIQLIREHVSCDELLSIFLALVKQMDVNSFLSSIISIRGVNLLKEMNPKTQRSQIASGEQLAGG